MAKKHAITHAIETKIFFFLSIIFIVPDIEAVKANMQVVGGRVENTKNGLK